MVAIGACVPPMFGKETVGQLELMTEHDDSPERQTAMLRA